MQERDLYSLHSHPSNQSGPDRSGRPNRPNQQRESSEVPWFYFEDLDQPPQAPPDFLSNYELLALNDWLTMPRMIVRQWKPPVRPEPVIAANGETESSTSTPQTMTEVWLIIHHAWCDGGGGIAIISDWMEIYENLISGKAPFQGMIKVDLQRFWQRNHLGLTRWSYLKRIPFQWVGLYGACKFIFRRTAQFSSSSTDIAGPGSDQLTYQPQLCSRWVESEVLIRLDAADQQAGQNVNARLLAEWFGVLESFFLQFVLKSNKSKMGRRPWIRVIVPINIREVADRRLSAANRSSLVQVDRRNLQCPASDRQVGSIYRELKVIIGWKLDRLFLIAIRLMSWVPGLLARVAKNDKHRGLSVFTNLGTPFRRWEKRQKQRGREPLRNDQKEHQFQEDGQREYPHAHDQIQDRNPSEQISESGYVQFLDPLELDFVAPLRSGTPFNLTLARSRGRLRLSLHYDPSFVDQQQANWLMDNFLRRLKIAAEMAADGQTIENNRLA